jgi:hypothetical protein
MGKYATGRAWTVVIVAVTLMTAAATILWASCSSAARPVFEMRASGVVVPIERNRSEIARERR